MYFALLLSGGKGITVVRPSFFRLLLDLILN